MNQIILVLFLTIFSFSTGCKKDYESEAEKQTSYQINEDGTDQDFLTPNYYDTNETVLRDEINKFIHFTRLEIYQHPFEDANGAIANHSINRAFGDGIGMGGTAQHHPATDLHPSNPSDITIYAMHDGVVCTNRESPKYRHYLTITKSIKDADDNPIGKLVSLYAHIDLDLDESELLQLNGVSVNKGDIISQNLYTGTMGGPHLHFEIRLYRHSEKGNEDFYSWQNSEDYTTPSAGIWSYGYWNPETGYGFGNPINFGIE